MSVTINITWTTNVWYNHSFVPWILSRFD